MDVSLPSDAALAGIPYCITVVGPVAPPVVHARRGIVQILGASSPYTICVTPNFGVTSIQIFLESGSQRRSFTIGVL